MTTTKKKEDKPVNVYNEEEMRKAGFPRPENKKKYDFSKSKKDKKAIKRAKYTISFYDGHFRFPVESFSCIRAKIIVQLKKNKTFPNTTYSKIINRMMLDSFLSKFTDNKGKSLISKYSFNGKTYAPEERPYNVW